MQFIFPRKGDVAMRQPLLAPLVLAVSLTGCSTVGEYASSSPAPEQSPVPSAGQVSVPAPDWGEQVYMTAYGVEDRPEPVFSPEYRLPEIKNAGGIPAYEAINAYYQKTLDALAASAAEMSGWAVEDYNVTRVTKEPFFTYTDTETYEIALDTGRWASILRSHYSSLGGPSPCLYPVGDTFDLSTGARLDFAGLFTCDAQTAAGRVLDAVLAQNAQGAYMGVVIDEDILRRAYDPEQFYLTGEALTVYFPEGELPGALGSPTFAVSYSELEDIFALWE